MRSLFIASTLFLACGPAVTYDVGKNEGSGSGSATTAPPPTTAAGDESVEVPAIDVKGVVFDPTVFDTYGIPGADAKKKTTLDAERKTFTQQKDPLQKQAHATILATMLFREAGTKTGAEAKALLDEARQALREATSGAGKQVDELALQLLARYEIFNEDYAASEKAWEALVTQFPKDKEVELSRAWWAYCLLKQNKNAEALALLKDPDKTPEQVYVAAWAKLRTGDNAGAWTAIRKALAAWTTPAANKDNSEREGKIRIEALRFAARTGVSLADAQTAFGPIWGKQPGEVYELDKKLSSSMRFAGRWADAIAANQAAITVAGDKAPPNEKVAILLENAEFQVKLDDPTATEKWATDAVNALPACGSACTPQDGENVVVSVFGIAANFHVTYAAANDARYYQPAHDLYQLVLPKIMDNKTRSQAGDYSGKLESTKAVMKPTMGRLGKDVAARVVNDHNQEVQACYEATLAGNPKLSGNIVLTLDVEQAGNIKGASTDPKAGAADMSAVAGCVTERAKTWKFPARGSKGSTRVKVTYAAKPHTGQGT